MDKLRLQKLSCHIIDRRYIEQASRSAPSPTVTVNKTSYSRSDDSSSKYSSSTQAQSSSSHGNYKSAATIAVSSSNVTESSSDKRNIKKYGSKLDTTGSPSRSRMPPDDSLMCAPNFTIKLQDITMNDGDQLLLSCTVEGDPEPQVTWSKNGQPLSSSDIIDLKYKNGVATLTITEVFPEDEAEYACTAKNSIGSISTKSKLSVTLPNEEPKSPVFKTFPQSATLQEGESVSFNCETEKVPLKVTWLKDGKPVDETSSKYQFVQDGKKKFKFEITNCNSLDVGQYTAKAVGKKGETTAAFSLNVCPAGEL
uniref:(California timema) hypothetical protein n=1 Tax=Timema californicum TaxID=61474 RepID=A0A7R9IUZ0_TIMCA|nr:unnamed protein product [Timema californicum]